MSVELIGKNGTQLARTEGNGAPIFDGDIATPASVGALRICSNTKLTGNLDSAETSNANRLRVGTPIVLFTDTFNVANQNTNLWSYTFATMTVASSSTGVLRFGAVQGTTNAHGAFLRTYQYFPIIGNSPLTVDFTVGIEAMMLVIGEVFEFGFGLPTSATARPGDGIWFRLTQNGMCAILSFNGNVYTTPNFVSISDIVLSQMYKWSITIEQQAISFLRDGVNLFTFTTGGLQYFQSRSYPVFMHRTNLTTVSNTSIIKVGSVTVSLADICNPKPWPHIMAGMGQMGYVTQNGTAAVGKTSFWTNNTAPTAAAATNTAALQTTLGGICAVLPTLAANNDGILFDYTNPASTVNITGRNLIICGVNLQGIVTVILAGGPVAYKYGIAFGHTSTSQATTETGSFVTATTHAPRRVYLGDETYVVTAPVGTRGNGVYVKFDSPIVVRPGEHVALIARNVGVVTTTGAITIGCMFDCYWE